MLWPPAVAIRVPPKRDVPQQTPQRASPQARHGEPALLNTRACARLRSHQQHPPDDPAEAEAETEASTTPALPITARAQTRTNERTEGKNKGVPRRRNCAKRRTDTQPQTDLRTQKRAETKNPDYKQRREKRSRVLIREPSPKGESNPHEGISLGHFAKQPLEAEER